MCTRCKKNELGETHGESFLINGSSGHVTKLNLVLKIQFLSCTGYLSEYSVATCGHSGYHIG